MPPIPPKNDKVVLQLPLTQHPPSFRMQPPQLLPIPLLIKLPQLPLRICKHLVTYRAVKKQLRVILQLQRQYTVSAYVARVPSVVVRCRRVIVAVQLPLILLFAQQTPFNLWRVVANFSLVVARRQATFPLPLRVMFTLPRRRQLQQHTVVAPLVLVMSPNYAVVLEARPPPRQHRVSANRVLTLLFPVRPLKHGIVSVLLCPIFTFSPRYLQSSSPSNRSFAPPTNALRRGTTVLPFPPTVSRHRPTVTIELPLTFSLSRQYRVTPFTVLMPLRRVSRA